MTTPISSVVRSTRATSSARRRSTISSSRSPVPMPCSAESANGSPRPSSWYSSASSWRAGLSSLFATSSTGTRERRRRSASSRSAGPGAVVASTSSSTRSASLIASSAWRTISPWNGPSSPASTPPVSISANRSPPHSTTICLRSRVTPGSECTTVSRVAVRRLTSVDLPAFGSPTIATVPSSVRSVVASASAVRWRELRERGASSLMRSPPHRRPRGRAGARRRSRPACGAAGARARAAARPSSSTTASRYARPRCAVSETCSGGPNMTVTGWRRDFLM